MKLIEIDKKTKKKYLTGIAEVHLQAYSKEHFTAHFSLKKLELYYSALIDASDLSIIVTDKENVAGFIIAGCKTSEGVVRFKNENYIYIAMMLFLHPKFLFQRLNLFFSRNNNCKHSRAKFRLLSIAVSPIFQSKGIGKFMLDYFESILINRSELSYGLSVKSSNKKAISFYEKMEFAIEKESHGSKYYFKLLKSQK